MIVVKDSCFIFTRCVRSPEHNILWKRCYKSIRNFYPENKIIIIDDSSDKDMISEEIKESEDPNLIMIESEYRGRGEILPYYYFLKYKWAPSALILHDSTFLVSGLEDQDGSKFLWDFDPYRWDDRERIIELACILDNWSELIKTYYSVGTWRGCFGAMMFISLEDLEMMDEKYKFPRLLGSILTRGDRCNWERLLSLMFICLRTTTMIKEESPKQLSMFGSIHNHYNAFLGRGSMDLESYINRAKEYNSNYKIIKAWNSR